MTDNLTPEGVPVFGRGTDHVSTVPFAIEIYDLQTGTTEDVYFTALKDPGGGPFLAFIRASQAGGDALLQGAARLLFTAAVDTDGLSADYRRPEEGDVDPRVNDMEQWSSRRRFTHYVGSDDHHIGKEVLPQLAKWLAKQAAGPTGGTTAGASSAASSGGPTTKRRGSGARPARKG